MEDRAFRASRSCDCLSHGQCNASRTQLASKQCIGCRPATPAMGHSILPRNEHLPDAALLAKRACVGCTYRHTMRLAAVCKHCWAANLGVCSAPVGSNQSDGRTNAVVAWTRCAWICGCTHIRRAAASEVDSAHRPTLLLHDSTEHALVDVAHPLHLRRMHKRVSKRSTSAREAHDPHGHRRQPGSRFHLDALCSEVRRAFTTPCATRDLTEAAKPRQSNSFHLAAI